MACVWMGEELSSKSVYFPTISRWLLFNRAELCLYRIINEIYTFTFHFTKLQLTHSEWAFFFFSLNTPMANGVCQWWCTNTLNCLEIRYNLSRGDSDETKKMNDNVILTLAASNRTGSAHGQEHSCAWRSDKKSLRAAIFLLIII